MPSLKTTSSRPSRQQQQPPPPPPPPPTAAVSHQPQLRFSTDISIEVSPPPEADRRSSRCAETVATTSSSRHWRCLKAAAVATKMLTSENVPNSNGCNVAQQQPNDDCGAQSNLTLSSVPLDVGQKSFDECELSNQLAIIDARAEDEMRHFIRRQQRNAGRMRKGLYQLVPTGSTTHDAAEDGDAMFGDDVGTNAATCSEELTPGAGGEQVATGNAADTSSGVGIGGKPKSSGKVRRFRLWFDVSAFDPDTVRVDFDVNASMVEVSATTSSDSGPLSFHRAISVSGPDPIDRHSVRAVRTAEGLLVVEGLTAPYVQVSRGRRRRRRHRGDVIGTDRSFSSVVCRLRDALRSQRSDSLPVQRSESFGSPLIDDDQRAATGRCDDDADIDASTRKLLPDNDDQTAADEESLEDDASDDGSADHQQSVSGPYDNMAPAPVKKPQREKIGAATFYKDDNGIRRMKLIIDMGKAFHGSDVVLQYIKDDKIQVKAKNQFKSKERSSRARFNREYELTEKIECRSLTGRFDPSNGRLIVEAVAKKKMSGDLAEMIGNICRICIGPTSENTSTMKTGENRGDVDNGDAGGEMDQT